VITIHQRYRRTDGRTDGQTDRERDRQTTCDRNTARCTKVHRAAKTRGMGLLYGENCIVLTSAVFDSSTSVTDRRTDDSIRSSYVHCLLIDFSKAFDVVDHTVLVAKFS